MKKISPPVRQEGRSLALRHLLFLLIVECAIMKVQSFNLGGSGLSFTNKKSITPHTSLSAGIDDDDDEMDDLTDDDTTKPSSCNVLGTPLEPCCTDVGGTGIGTGFYRNGYCSTGDQDSGRHTVCVRATDEFLEFSRAAGNDLSTPFPQYSFPGLNDGDIWCLCAQRWAQAYNAGKAPKLYLAATHEKTLDYVPVQVLMEYAIDKHQAMNVLNQLNEDRDKLNRLL